MSPRAARVLRAHPGWRWLALAAVASLLVMLGAFALERARERQLEALHRASAQAPTDAGAVLRSGAELAGLGNCAGCHTAPGGAAYAGGRAIQTPFGAVYAPNLTPDPESGLGRWTEADFARALRLGRSRDGRRLVPAFPYTHYAGLSDAEVHSLWTYLQALPAVQQAPHPQGLAGPLGTPLALMVWRALYLRDPQSLAAPPLSPIGTANADTPQLSATLARGAALVHGLAHCSLCHASRNTLGGVAAAADALRGGLMPGERWLAPSLHDPAQAGVQDWPLADIVALLQGGPTARGIPQGPMADVVAHGTRHAHPDDLQAIALYLQRLQRLPRISGIDAPPATTPLPPEVRARGARVYEQHCERCHGAQGEGAETPGGQRVYPALAGNRIVAMSSPNNLVRSLIEGGYAPSTPAQPRPYGMPPYGWILGDEDLAAVASYLRQSWGHQASAVTPLQVQALR